MADRHPDQYEVLMKTASPSLYRANAFRVLGLPVNVSMQQLRRREREIAVFAKMELAPEEIAKQLGGFLPLYPPPDMDMVREAWQRLQDLENRIVDEFFWFWPLSPGLPAEEDEALLLLKQGDYQGSVAVWRGAAESGGGGVALHNLAVFYHALALDIEYTGKAVSLSEKQRHQKESYWKEAYAYWKGAIGTQDLWERLLSRVKEISDPRLTIETVERVRFTLPLALLSINGNLAVQAVERGNRAEASLHLRLIQESGFDNPVIGEALRFTVAREREQIRLLCGSAKDDTERQPERGAEIARQLISQTARPLEVIDTLLPPEHPVREAVHDDVALQILQSQVAFAKKTDDWQTSLGLLEEALATAAGVAAREQIKENIEIVKNNLRWSVCWFCGENPAEDDATLEVKMYGEVTRNLTFRGVRIQWRQVTVRVPRCNTCRSVHQREEVCLAVGGIAGFALGMGGCIAVEGGGSGFVFFVVSAVLSTAIGWAIGRFSSPKGTKPETAQAEFPGVLEMKAKGWEIGERPPEAQGS